MPFRALMRCVFWNSCTELLDQQQACAGLRRCSTFPRLKSNDHCQTETNDAGNSSLDNEVSQMSLRQPDRELLCFDTDRWNHITNSPLYTRGWVSKEGCLSRPTLYFANDQIPWECQQFRASETLPRVNLAFHAHVSPVPRKILSSTSQLASPTREARAAWTAYVEHYSAGKLTVTEDKLPAISGLARRLQRHFDGTPVQMTNRYYLGPEFAHRRYGRYVAPSWSWAPLEGPIWMEWVTGRMSSRINFKKLQSVARIVDVHADLLGTDPFGHVQDASLYLQGWIFKGKLLTSRTFLTENLQLASPSGESSASMCLLFRADSPNEFQTIAEDLYCVPILRSQTFTAGLVLCLTGQSQGQYMRTGAFGGTDSDVLDLHPHLRQTELSDSEYTAFDGEDQYTICTV
ncbi:uncharacterized protein PAC_02573 [Phialocephala subalpina]|uniref:Heterokaryon incompatibility domain-containing protein n=1 Tax=Phialocephala subalpina TaxID=576137 RepID=A0A1L7WIV3_9HELO|nr:uncharacterized protein PAC_02573 [Phialocephala subalpina]